MMVTTKISRVSAIQVAVVAVILSTTAVFSDDKTPIPEAKDEVEKWFTQNVGPLAEWKATLDPELVAAEAEPRIINLSPDGKGDFKSISDAINSIPEENKKRVIIKFAGGTYKEKINIDRTKHFITFLGDPKNMPNLTFTGTAKQYGTVDSATVIAQGNYFVAANIIFSNDAPMPDMLEKGAQALAIRVSGDKSAFYNCIFHGFQDTICDDKGYHFFKDCLIQGTVDFIFGSGKSIYLNSKLVVVGDVGGIIAAHARNSEKEDTGYSFVHCEVTGTANGTVLGRAWVAYGKVIYSYSTMSKIVDPVGWSHNRNPANAKTVFFAEYKNSGDGGDPKGRIDFTKQLTEDEAKEFLSLGFIEGSKWLLPPPQFDGVVGTPGAAAPTTETPTTAAPATATPATATPAAPHV